MDSELIFNMAANKTVSEINKMYNYRKLIDDVLPEAIRMYLSRNLIDTNENKKLYCSICLEGDAQGLSSLELPEVKSIWQDPEEGIIWLDIYGAEQPIELDDIYLEDQLLIVNELKFDDNKNKIHFVNDRSETQRGVKLNDGRIVSLYDENNQFYLRFDDVIDLEKGIIVSGSKGVHQPELTKDELANGYTTLNKLIREGKAEKEEVHCYDECSYDAGVWLNEYENDSECIDIDEIIDYFAEHGFNVTKEALQHNIDAWSSDFKSGYRDDENGYHLFTPCGCNKLSFRATSLDANCITWQSTYEV